MKTFDIGIFIYFGRTNMQIRLLNWLHFDSFLWFAGNKSDIFVQIHLQFSFSLSQYSIFQIQLKCDCVETHVLNIRERIILYWLKCVIYNRNIKHQEVWSVRYFFCSVVSYTAFVDQCSMFNSLGWRWDCRFSNTNNNSTNESFVSADKRLQIYCKLKSFIFGAPVQKIWLALTIVTSDKM